MKIRTDFVTNSSSSSFAVELKMNFETVPPIEVSFSRFTGDGEMCEMKYKERAFYTEEDYCDAAETPIFVECDCVPFAQIVGKGKTKSKIKVLQSLFSKENYYEDSDEDEDQENDIFDEMNSAFNNDVSAAFINASSLKSAELKAEFGGRGEMLYGTEEMVEHLFTGKLCEDIKACIPEYGSDLTISDVADSLKKIKEMEIYGEDGINEWARLFVECDCAPDECTINQAYDGNHIELEINWE